MEIKLHITLSNNDAQKLWQQVDPETDSDDPVPPTGHELHAWASEYARTSLLSTWQYDGGVDPLITVMSPVPQFAPEPTTLLGYQIWAVAAVGVSDRSGLGTIIIDGQAFPEVYATKVAAEQELADIIRDRLANFIEVPAHYDHELASALDSGWEVIEAHLRPDGVVIVGEKEMGLAPPDIRAAFGISL